MNNGVVAVMVAGVTGGMSGQTLTSGDTRCHPKVCRCLGGRLSKVKKYLSGFL